MFDKEIKGSKGGRLSFPSAPRLPLAALSPSGVPHLVIGPCALCSQLARACYKGQQKPSPTFFEAPGAPPWYWLISKWALWQWAYLFITKGLPHPHPLVLRPLDP